MPSPYDSNLTKKLNLKRGMRTRIVAPPEDVDLAGLARTDSAEAEGLLVFIRTLEEAEIQSAAVSARARAGAVVWMAYPKARQLDTDLNRDILWRHMTPKGVQPVRQVSLDDTWSAIRFRASDEGGS